MGFSIFSNSGKKAYGITNFVVDYPSDIDNLPTHYTPGSMAFVSSNSTYYMLNTKKKWIKIKIATGGSNGNTGIEDDFDPTNYQNVTYNSQDLDLDD